MFVVFFRRYGFSINNVLSSITARVLIECPEPEASVVHALSGCNYSARLTVILEVRLRTYTGRGPGAGVPVDR